MSVKATTTVWDYYPEGGSEMMTALALADHADPVGGEIFPSVARVAAMTRQSERTVHYHIKAMIESGWLIPVKRGTGRGKTTTYRMPLNEIAQGIVERVQKLHPLLESEKACNPDTERVQKVAVKGATAVAVEQVLTKAPVNKPAKGAKAPSAVSTAFQAYQTGIKAQYGVDYPPSAKANGQLANLVARVGGDQAEAVVRYYLARTDQWLVKRKHGLDYLCKEGERWFLDMQQATGSGTTPVLEARTALVYADNKVAELKEYPPGEAEQIARKVLSEYRTKISNTKPKYISVLQGAKATRFSVLELQEAR